MAKGIKDKFCGGNNFKGYSGGVSIYCVGFIGSAIYYISTATSFWGGVFGVIKSLVWPAFLIFEAMKFLGM
ncbi:MAG: hypothetical protein ABIH25_04415 [Candidatus Woesearchaeota archaeon]